MADGKIQGGITQQKDREECHENVREKSDGKHRERPNQISHEKLHDEKGSVMDEKVDENSQREEKEHQEKEIPSCGDERSAEDMSKKSSSRVDVTSGQLMRCLSDKVPRASRLRFARLNRSETAKKKSDHYIAQRPTQRIADMWEHPDENLHECLRPPLQHIDHLEPIEKELWGVMKGRRHQMLKNRIIEQPSILERGQA
eukprot:CAMPEP_0170189754 /NCGR_PEP_ID=MMETSP0040_2-20121228/47597_1 /TAXON_ID=641309 /ORGANISM="Lotharella oceanica, Strain CCMP622" /LENGTH=199 /DNA_ID=CAMNT_0010437407 /DNA_START=769 /DNA_END=1369 /DNA_ORIENTATION=+